MKRELLKPSLLIAVVLLAFLTGCSKPQAQTETLYQSDSVKVERTGSQTVVYDLKGGTEYTFTAHKTRERKSEATHSREAITTADTETIKLQTVYDLIILEDKPAEQTYYIK
mgnify:CR=1 FL=1